MISLMRRGDEFNLVDYYDELSTRRVPGDPAGRTFWELGDLGRRYLTELDPLAFALIYLPHHLKGEATGDAITLADVHLAWIERAKGWVPKITEPYTSRHVEVGPREVGKSTWWFLILPMWAAAHGHVKFAAAFANTPTQAETHLASFKAELDGNELLRADFPDLCAPKTRGRGQVEADRVSLYHARNGFVFAAAGADSANLGMKVGNLRPDLIILDDIEPHEGNYSAAQARKRLDTLTSAILPLNIFARVVMVGTVTMAGSIIHNAVKVAHGYAPKPGDLEEWVVDERFQPHHYHAIQQNDDGTRRSLWPAKWSLAFLESIEHTRTFAKNYANDPIAADGDYWTADDFRRDPVPGITRRVLSIDPNVTQKASSDYTGLAVVGWAPSTNRCLVMHASQVKLDPASLRLHVLALIAEHNVGLVLVETNQGGDLWLRILHGLPVKVKVVHQHEPKEVRAARCLNRYQQGQVSHVPGLAALEGQMVAFPRAPHDDMVDAVGTVVGYFLERKKGGPAGEVAAIGYAA